MNNKFDFNEWYVLIVSLVEVALVWAIRKHFRPLTIVLMWVFNVAFVATIDYAIAATPFFWYYCMDNATYEFMSSWAHVFFYTPFSFYFLYFYDKWRIRGTRLIPYIAAWDCFSVLFEWINIQTGFITYVKWKLGYSVLVYPVAAMVLILVYRFVLRRLPDPGCRSKSPERA